MTFKKDIQLLCCKSNKVEETSDYADSKLKCFGVMYTSKGKKLKISKLLKDRRILIAQLWAVHQISLDE